MPEPRVHSPPDASNNRDACQIMGSKLHDRQVGEGLEALLNNGGIPFERPIVKGYLTNTRKEQRRGRASIKQATPLKASQ